MTRHRYGNREEKCERHSPLCLHRKRSFDSSLQFDTLTIFRRFQDPLHRFEHVQTNLPGSAGPSIPAEPMNLAGPAKAPREQAVAFRGASGIPGLPVSELSADQKEHMQKVLALLVEPYRKSDKDEALAALKKQGGLDKCTLSFYQEGDLGNDKVWDNWRLEGPAFVWHFRGTPHVHVWVNVADDPGVKTNT